ncbi:FxsB family cyclophane-forming radical SAM/SPASM peptide maturase [Streptomyces chartreusis]|uniref:FxsB family cyclophane-forming radical SAM/SPASM peptide maturase n=1 Tax=Streptomyces chartreusis TaxID=1969 RepID=UPI003434155D
MPAPEAIRPFRQFVMKVHSRCDLACDHCYVYRHADQSWRRRPRVMAPRIVRATAERIAEHARAHRLKRVTVVLHGGEPLLAGPERLAALARELRRSLDGIAVLDLRMQTNGLLLDDDFCALLVRERIHVGVSLDGDRASHDRHRVRADGSGSYDDTVRALRLLGQAAHRPAFAGLLCTIDVHNDPDAVYGALAEVRPPRVDFLLPHANWDHPPPRVQGTTDYADWLITAYERWNTDDRPFSIRVFESVEAAAMGEPGFTEALGLGSPDLLVIETDGAIEQADWLKTVAEGAPETGYHVLVNSFDEAARHTGFQARSLGLDGLAAQCRACPVVSICGGGLYGHRYRSGTGFVNPSVYCADLLKLIQHIQSTAPTTQLLAVPPDDIGALTAGGAPERAAVLRLSKAQLDLRRSMLAYLNRAGVGSEETWQALLKLDGPDLDLVLADPAVHSWAVTACSAEARGQAVPDTGFLAGVALAAAFRSGRHLELTVPVSTRAILTLPSVGRLRILPNGVSLSSGKGIRVGTDGGRVWRADGGGAIWEPVQSLSAGGFEVRLESSTLGATGAGALPDLTAAWRRPLEAAWGALSRQHPHQAAALAAGVTTLVLLDSEPAQDASRPPFGALALAPPGTTQDLVLALLREWQYAKFAALRDLHDLGGTGQEAALRQAYVHLAVARVWHTRPEPTARDLTVLWGKRSLAALDVLASEADAAPAPTGLRLAAEIRAAADSLIAGP